MKKRVIGYLHTHWDREWYREFEIFRMRLLRVIDEVLEALEKDLIPSFLFDGQTTALMDYLEIRPENEKRIRELIKSKKLYIGPFFCLVDEFLTSENLFKKNLEYGLKISKEFGCTDFTGYLPDTFGHSSGVIDILKSQGINECVVWRGCGDLPSEFIWQSETGIQINTINLIRGYFMDIFTTDLSIEKKSKILKDNLDKIAKKSSDILLLPIGADHLGMPLDIKEQIVQINNLLEDYEIELGSIFDYIKATSELTEVMRPVHKGELRDNTKTFTLEGAYSSRADLKRENIFCIHELERTEKLVNFYNMHSEYDGLIEYAYKLLLKNQAHDSICGCSTDDTHYENNLRYKKIHQIANTIIAEIKFKKNLYDKVLNLGKNNFSGVVEVIKYEKNFNDIILSEKKGFKESLLTDIKKIPTTEDYKSVYTVLEYVKNIPHGESLCINSYPDNKVTGTDTSLTNGIVMVKTDSRIQIITNKKILEIYPRDFKDNGDSYNRGGIKGDTGKIFEIKSCRLLLHSYIRSVLEVNYNEGIRLEISLDADSSMPDLKFEIDNLGRKNHHLLLCLKTYKPIKETISEDMNRFIKREFNPFYDIRENFPTQKGFEAKTNTAPCQRLVWANGIGAILKGTTQYEVFRDELRLSLLRASGVISNPKNPARTTPAGPPIETPDLQLQKTIIQNLSVFIGEEKDFDKYLNKIYNFVIV